MDELKSFNDVMAGATEEQIREAITMYEGMISKGESVVEKAPLWLKF